MSFRSCLHTHLFEPRLSPRLDRFSGQQTGSPDEQMSPFPNGCCPTRAPWEKTLLVSVLAVLLAQLNSGDFHLRAARRPAGPRTLPASQMPACGPRKVTGSRCVCHPPPQPLVAPPPCEGCSGDVWVVGEHLPWGQMLWLRRTAWGLNEDRRSLLSERWPRGGTGDGGAAGTRNLTERGQFCANWDAWVGPSPGGTAKGERGSGASGHILTPWGTRRVH